MALLDDFTGLADNATVQVADALVDLGLHATPVDVLQDHLASLEKGLSTGSEKYVVYPEPLIAALRDEIKLRLEQ